MPDNEKWIFKDLKKIIKVKGSFPELQPDEVILKVLYVGICGSDLHAYEGTHPLVHPEIVLGHEVTGEIIKIGSSVKNLKIGDKVVLEPNISCGECYNCKHGKYNICENLKVIGCVGRDGGLQNFVALPANKLYKVNNIPPKLATLIEPFSVGIHSVRISSFTPGNEVLLYGAGPIGIFTSIFLYLSGAKKIVVVDLVEKRLQFLSSLLPGIITTTPADTNIKGYFTFDGPDIVFDCVGADATLNMAIDNARKGDEIVLVGVPSSNSNVKLIYVQDRELTIRGSLMYVVEDYLTAINLLEKNQIDYEKIITHVFPFDKVPEAYEYALNNKNEVLKILIEVNQM